MITEVCNTPLGYVVRMYYSGQWWCLRNFGERQGDARDYAFTDCKELSLDTLRHTAKKYNPCRIWQRLKYGSYRCIEIR